MPTKNKKPATLDDLATMMNGGFTATQTHMDEQLDALKGEMMGVMKDMAEELATTHEDVRYVRTTVTTLAQSDAAHEAAIASLRKRVERVERKVGITK
jgi:nitrogen fixation/metabolism regulation signal transduction histidine kinase